MHKVVDGTFDIFQDLLDMRFTNIKFVLMRYFFYIKNIANPKTNHVFWDISFSRRVETFLSPNLESTQVSVSYRVFKVHQSSL